MYKIVILGFSTVMLLGCSSAPKSVVEGYNPVYMPPTVHNPNYAKHCYYTWDNTVQGYRERKVCG